MFNKNVMNFFFKDFVELKHVLGEKTQNVF